MGGDFGSKSEESRMIASAVARYLELSALGTAAFLTD